LEDESVPRLLLVAAIAPFFVFTTVNGAGIKLVYELEEQGTQSKPKMVRMMALHAKVRLELDGIQGAEVRPAENNRIAIILPDDDPKLIERAKRSVARPGHLEFRILADTRVAEHSKVIELATAKPADKSEVYSKEKKLVAKWLRIAPGALAARTKALVSRMDKVGNEETLALVDEFNVTGEFVSRAWSTLSESGVSVAFELDEKGAKLLGELTASNLPDATTGVARELAIVVDDEIFSAAGIRSKIMSRGQITGRLTEAETAGLAGILNEAAVLKSVPPLPKLKLVSESKTDKP
jgi:preprotein translocase subunit SecD